MTEFATPATNVLGGPFKPSFGLSGRPRFPQAPDVIRSEAEGSAVRLYELSNLSKERSSNLPPRDFGGV